jgi:AraC-like DNA-binding protein
MSNPMPLTIVDVPHRFVPTEAEKGVVVLLRQAVAFLRNDRAAAKTCIDQAAALLDSRAGKDAPSRSARRGALAPWQGNQIAAHVARNLDSPLGVAELAAVVGLSTSYFSKAFKASFGITPHAYVIDRRLQRAKEMMLSTDEPLAQIAIACGLADQSHLSRLFRQETGVRPFAWRRLHGERTALTLASHG